MNLYTDFLPDFTQIEEVGSTKKFSLIFPIQKDKSIKIAEDVPQGRNGSVRHISVVSEEVTESGVIGTCTDGKKYYFKIR